MSKGGRRTGAGRPKGSRDKGKAALEAVATLNGTTPIAFFASILADEARPLELRFAAAKELAPYMHPKLSSIDAKIDATLKHESLLDRVAAMEQTGEL